MEDLSFLRHAEGVASVLAPGDGRSYWVVEIKEGADGRALLKACFEAGVVPDYFDVSPPSLHDVFVAVVEKAQ